MRSSRCLRSSFLALGVAVASSSPSVLLAAPLDGRVRLSLETGVLSYEKTTLSAAGVEMPHSGTSFSVGGAGFGLGVGVGLGENWLFGGRALYSNDSLSAGGDAAATTTSSIGISVTPEYVLDGGAVRPFVGVTLGHRATSTKSAGPDTSTSLTFVGPSLGLHWFATDSFSIDPNVQALYETGGGSAAGLDVSESGYAILVGVGLSGWLGGTIATVPASTSERTLPSQAGTPPSVVAVVPGSAPSPAPEPGTAAEFHDLRLTIPLGGPTRLLLNADPERGTGVEVVLIASDSEDLRECDALTAETSKDPVVLGPFTKTKVGAGTGALLALSTQAPLSAIRALGRGKGSLVLEGCEQSLELTEATRSVLTRFTSVVKRALRGREPESTESADLSAGASALREANRRSAANGSGVTASRRH